MTYVESTTALIAPMGELAALRVIHATGDAAESVQGLATMLGAVTGERVRRVLVLWAADCAERVLPLFEAKFPDDKRPREAVEAARSLDWGATYAARAADAARAATYAADAATYAARAADAARAARAADAARAATYAADAATYAARAARAARAAETMWQKQRLLYWIGKEIDLL